MAGSNRPPVILFCHGMKAVLKYAVAVVYDTASKIIKAKIQVQHYCICRQQHSSEGTVVL